MRYGNRLKLQNLMKYPLPGESSLTRSFILGSDISYQRNRELSQSRNNLQPGSYGYSIETDQFKSPAPHAANDYRLIAAYPCRRVSNKYRNMTSSGPIVKTERYRVKQAPSFKDCSIYGPGSQIRTSIWKRLINQIKKCLQRGESPNSPPTMAGIFLTNPYKTKDNIQKNLHRVK